MKTGMILVLLTLGACGGAQVETEACEGLNPMDSAACEESAAAILEEIDTDQDSIPDTEDMDDDNDSVADEEDPFPQDLGDLGEDDENEEGDQGWDLVAPIQI